MKKDKGFFPCPSITNCPCQLSLAVFSNSVSLPFLLFLTVICVCSVLSVIMLILQFLWSRLNFRIDHLAACSCLLYTSDAADD